MRHDKKIKNELVERAESVKQDYIDIVDVYIKDLNLARSIEGIMRAKQRLLFFLMSALPTTSHNCYFCIENACMYPICSFCKYAKHHGGKCTEKYSDFFKMRTAKQELLNVIRKDYYKGEKYNET